MAKKKSTSKKEQPSFEEALDHLKLCLQALESDELTLDESLDQYEKGVGYLKECHRAIATAKQKIEKLVKIDAAGNAVVEPFDNTASEKTTSGTRRGSAQTAKSSADDGSEDDDDIDDSEGLF